MSPRALITGITGQDGSYLADLLLQRGYEVHGMVRRSSTEKFDRIEHIRDRLTLHQGDLFDQRSLVDTLRASTPDEIYNLAAMSYVAASWVQPTLTAEFSGIGVTRLLEAMREVCPEARFYQASSSEMFGKVREVPQTELTPFYPRSPYGVAKAYGHFITVNYRESYGLHATSGILFNHECVHSQTPLIVREDGILDVRAVEDLVSPDQDGAWVQAVEPSRLLEVWDGTDFTDVLAVTATRRRPGDPDHRLLSFTTAGGTVTTTAHHGVLDARESIITAEDVEVGDRLLHGAEYPRPNGWSVLAPELAELLGLLCARADLLDGLTRPALHLGDDEVQQRASMLLARCFLGSTDAAGTWLRDQLSTGRGRRRVPPVILNADLPTQACFLDAFADVGDPANTQEREVAAGSVLAQGLWWMTSLRHDKTAAATPERLGRENRSPGRISSTKASVLDIALPENEVLHIAEHPEHSDTPTDPADEWVYDLETASGRFNAGVGRIVVHNSPRRGLEFVTRKITWHAAAIRLGLRQRLALGNLDAERDWGYAGDYVEAMWLMLQRPQADDYVIATGETHSVRECVEIAFDQAGIAIDGHVITDPALLRPAEVEQLIGDASKAKAELGWQPRMSFEQLIRSMVDADAALLSGGRP